MGPSRRSHIATEMRSAPFPQNAGLAHDVAGPHRPQNRRHPAAAGRTGAGRTQPVRTPCVGRRTRHRRWPPAGRGPHRRLLRRRQTPPRRRPRRGTAPARHRSAGVRPLPARRNPELRVGAAPSTARRASFPSPVVRGDALLSPRVPSSARCDRCPGRTGWSGGATLDVALARHVQQVPTGPWAYEIQLRTGGDAACCPRPSTGWGPPHGGAQRVLLAQAGAARRS